MTQPTHSLTSKPELAVAALGSVYAVNEFEKALEDLKGDPTNHYLKAAVSAAVAVGAFHQLQKKAEAGQAEFGGRQRRGSSSSSDSNHYEPPHHHRHLLEEAAGAYGLGRELLGDKRHHVTHLIAEAMGAAALIKDLNSIGGHQKEPGK